MKLSEALSLANEQGLDVVEVNSKTSPPIVKIVDFKKFKYEEDKKERKAKSKTKETHTKEIWLGPTIIEHDLNIRLKWSEEFFSKGDRVKFTVKFSGREMAHTNLGYELLNKIRDILVEKAQVDGEPRFMGRNLSLAFKSVKTK